MIYSSFTINIIWKTTFILYGKPHSYLWKTTSQTNGKIELLNIGVFYATSSFCNARNTPLFKRKIGVHNYAVFSTCDLFSLLRIIHVLQVQKCLKYLYLFVMYSFSCQLLPLFEYTKYQTLTPTSRVQYSPKP